MYLVVAKSPMRMAVSTSNILTKLWILFPSHPQATDRMQIIHGAYILLKYVPTICE